jgi:glycosyltransferase involved in cell wall biosynthesis
MEFLTALAGRQGRKLRGSKVKMMSDTPEETSDKAKDRPLVTFALIAYNQEKYIREAVEGAFSQTYERLEIIMSDDYSNDRTFDIMKEMAAAYKGPHEIVLNRNSTNLGLICHVNLIFELAKGDYIAAAAGDDISLPNRVEAISEEIIKTYPSLIHSDIQAIDVNGNPRKDISYNPTLWNTLDPKVAATSVSLYIGATGVWNKNLFHKYGKIDSLNAYEDLVLGYRASLEGNVAFIKKPLVQYRVGSGISHIPKKRSGRASKRKFLARMNASRIASFEQRLLDTKNSDSDNKSLLISLLQRQIRLYQARVRFYTKPLDFIKKDVWVPEVFFNFSSAAIRAFTRGRRR